MTRQNYRNTKYWKLGKKTNKFFDTFPALLLQNEDAWRSAKSSTPLLFRGETSHDSTRKMTRFDSTRRARVESVNFAWLKNELDFFPLLFIRQSGFRRLIYDALETDKSKIRLLSLVLALTRESRVGTPTRLEWLESMKSWLVPPLLLFLCAVRVLPEISLPSCAVLRRPPTLHIGPPPPPVFKLGRRAVRPAVNYGAASRFGPT